MEEIALSPDGESISFTLNEGGMIRLGVYSPSLGTSEWIDALPKGVLGSLSWLSNESFLFTLKTPTNPGDIWKYDLTTKQAERLTFIGGHPDEGVGVVLLMNTGGAQEARSVIVRSALDSVLRDAARRARSGRPVASPPPGRYRSTYWGVTANVEVVGDVPVVTTPSGEIASADSVGRLTREAERWRADGGMFDGCELDFDTTAEEGRRFYGGVYAFEFVADDADVVTLPVEVDAAGELGGAWVGTTDTPLGPIPLELEVQAREHAVTIAVMGAEGTDTGAETHSGWIRAQFSLDVAGFGPLTAFARLGLVGAHLEGLLYVRTGDVGELCFQTALARA